MPIANNNPTWEVRYARQVALTDTLVVSLALTISYLLRYGVEGRELEIGLAGQVSFVVEYLTMAIMLGISWLFLLSLADTRNPKQLDNGVVEYVRVINATLLTFGLLAIVGFSVRAQVGRGFLLIALPLGLALLLITRGLWRRKMQRNRAQGLCMYRTLVVGEWEKVAHVSREIQAAGNHGFDLVGAVTAGGTQQDTVLELPVLGDYERLLEVVDAKAVDNVIITSADALTPAQMQQIGWELESRQVDLIVAAALTDIAGPRIHVRPVSGLPLIQVDYPTFTGRKYFLKRLFDIVGSIMLIILLSPVMLAVALAVKLTSPGPIFYSQERVGLDGKPFPMFKFRSMVVGADDQLKKLLEKQGTADKPLHKIEDDPRITPVGHFIRKYSLDELPQFFNVFLGTMSLVGPRPQREAEVALYAPHHHRRLFVKPGVTGLWQVSGRSDMDWEDAIRLDLYYVENWSLTGDIVILWRTIGAVLNPEGAR